MAYIDTSVLAAYYCPERLSPKVQKALAGLGEATISPLVELELHSAVAMKVRLHDMDVPTATRSLAAFRVHLEEGLYRMVPVQAREYSLACQWLAAFSMPLRAPDALHLAAVFANGLTLLTSDKDLARAAKHFGVRHELIR
jgi:hypothetical protein